MAFTVSSDSDTNDVALPSLLAKSGSVSLKGRSNRVYAGSKTILREVKIGIFGNENTLHIGAECKIRGHILIKGNRQNVTIGDFTTFGDVYILAQENCNVTIGRFCMFSREIQIRTTDAHSVVDMVTGTRLNKPSSIVIGDHVWLGLRVIVSKGVSIASDCVIGAGSLVNKSIDETNVIAAGVPAKILRKGITWNRNRKEAFSKQELWDWKETI